jgi:imidazolonepropionase-like amidohydrolase
MALMVCGAFPLTAGAETLLIRGATVHTVSGPVYSPGQVLIEEGRIIAVDETVEAGDAEVVDLEGLHLYPGMIAADTSLGLVEINAVRATRDTSEVGDYTPDVRSWVAVNPDSELIPVARANGITHAQPVPQGGIVTGQSGVIALDGWTFEDMTILNPVALHVFWPGMALNTTPKEEYRDRSRWKSLEDQAKERRKRLEELKDFFAEARAYEKAKRASESRPETEFKEVPAWEAMLPYVSGDLPLMVHADDRREIEAALDWAEEEEYRIVLAGGRDAWLVADRLAKAEVAVVFEHVFTQPTRATDPYDAHFKAPRVLHQAGVKVAFSNGLGGMAASKTRNLPYEAAQAMAFGLSREEALKGVTLYPAEILGLAARLGSIEPGKEATLVVADGDILDVRSRVTRMWIAGREVNLENRHTRLYEKYKARPQPEL